MEKIKKRAMKKLPELTNVKTVYLIQVTVSETEGYVHQKGGATQFYSNVLKAENEAHRLAEAGLPYLYTVVCFDYTIN